MTTARHAELVTAFRPKCPECGLTCLRERAGGRPGVDRWRLMCSSCEFNEFVELPEAVPEIIPLNAEPITPQPEQRTADHAAQPPTAPEAPDAPDAPEALEVTEVPAPLTQAPSEPATVADGDRSRVPASRRRQARPAVQAAPAVTHVALVPPPEHRHCYIIGNYWTLTDDDGRVVLQMPLDDVVDMVRSCQR